MKPEVLDYIKTERIGVVAIEMPDGSPHAATVHFAYTENPFSFIVLTDSDSRKCEFLQKGNTARATFVVGTNESAMKTFQLDGEVSVSDEQGTEDTYFERFPEKRNKFSLEGSVFLVFTPRWWRFTDYKAPQGKLTIASE